jgi:hypothetical protein
MNLFPTTSTTSVEESTTTTLTFPKTWAFDANTGDFTVAPNGKMVEVSDVDAWYEWCKNALDVERYKHLVHSRSFGHELFDLMRLNLNRKAFESEVKRIVSETLKVDPRTDRVEDFTFKWGTDTLDYTFTAYNSRQEQVTISQTIATI